MLVVMVAAPPAIYNNNNAIWKAATSPTKPTSLAASLEYRTDTPPKSQRGHNKPKCKQCGNIARSRNASRVASLGQLCNSFAQFNNLHVSLRLRKPLTRKDVASINQWRFSKLKEYKERIIEAENDAFDRCIQNVYSLEEVLSVESPDDNITSALVSSPASLRNNAMMILPLKFFLGSNSERSNCVRKKENTIDR